MPWQIVERRIGRAGTPQQRQQRQRRWDQRYGVDQWAIGYQIAGEFVLQEHAIESIYNASYAAHFEQNPADLAELLALAKTIYNPHAQATNNVDLQVPAILAYLKRQNLQFQGHERLAIGSWQGQASHPLSIRLSPLHIQVINDPDTTLEQFWQEQKMFGPVGRLGLVHKHNQLPLALEHTLSYIIQSVDVDICAGVECMVMQQVVEQSLTIQQMAEITGLSAHTLRYYERAGLLHDLVDRNQQNGYRSYTQRHINWIHFIKCLRATGMPIRDIRRYTELLHQGDHTVRDRLNLLKAHRLRVEQQLTEVQQHLEAVKRKISYYETLD